MKLDLGMNKSELIKSCIMIVLGSFVCAIGTNLFIIPSKLLSGGVSGVALIFQYLIKVPMGYTILILNIPLFILSAYKINKKFTIFTTLGTLSLSLGLIISQPLNSALSPVSSSNLLLYCIYGGVLNGLGLGIVFTNQGSTGGLDIIGVYIKKKFGINLGSINFGINLIIVSIGSLLFGFNIGLYTLISMYASAAIMEKTIKGFNSQKMIFIVTKKQDKVAKAIMEELGRGVTVLYGEGAYTHDKRNVLYCIVSLGQLPKTKHIIKSVDNAAFVSIIDTAEVQGKGFSNPLS